MRLDVEADAPAGRRHWPAAGAAPDASASSTASLESDAAARVKTAATRIDKAESVVVLAGPGVVRAQSVAGLHALAGALGAGVLNTWGAKGVFHWQSRHHWATIGLQEHDFALGGLGDAGLIVATGVDDREAPGEYWHGRPHVVVEPEDLDILAEVVTPRRHHLAEMPPLRTRLAAATQAGWASTVAPLAPSQATLAYGRRLAGGGLVAADAGVAGFWVARTFATTQLGGVAVPAEEMPGWAAACVTVARMAAPLRPALAVAGEKVDEATSLVLELAHEPRHRGGCGGVERGRGSAGRRAAPQPARRAERPRWGRRGDARHRRRPARRVRRGRGTAQAVAAASSRSRNFMTLPLGLRGKASTVRTLRGTL